MAGFSDILLRFKADTRDVDNDLNRLDAKADKTKKTVDSVEGSVQRADTRLTRMVGRMAEFATTVAGGVTATMAVGQQVFDTFDELVLQPRRQDLEARLGRAQSSREALDIIADLSKGSWGWRKAFDVVLGSSKNFEQREFLQRFRSLSAAEKTALIAQIRMEDRGWLTELLPKLIEEAAPATDWAQAFKTPAAATKPVTVQNVYTSIYAGGGRGTVGRQITAATDIRDRNNGRYVTTLTRRG